MSKYLNPLERIRADEEAKQKKVEEYKNYIKQQKQIKDEEEYNHYMNRAKDFIRTFNDLYPDIKRKYKINLGFKGDNTVALWHIDSKNYQQFQLINNVWYIADGKIGYKLDIKEPLTTKEQMDKILTKL